MRPTNVHESYDGDWMESRLIRNGFDINLNHLVFGVRYESAIFNPFTRYKHDMHRFNEDPVAANGTLHYEQDDFERRKIFKPHEDDVAGTTHMLPRNTDEQRQHFYNSQGESIYSNPWPFHKQLVDHEIDEENIWEAPFTQLGLSYMHNPWLSDPESPKYLNNLPRWTGKFAIASWMNKEKFDKWHRHYGYRLGLYEVFKR